MDNRKAKIAGILAILLCAFILRTVFVFFIHPPEKYLYSDMGDYHYKAVKLSKGVQEGIFDSFHPPGTHYLYSAFFRLPQPFFWIKIFNILAGVISCLFIYLSTKILFTEKAARIALIISSANYLFIDFSGYLMSETPFILGLSVMFYFILKSIVAKGQQQKWLYSFLAGLFIVLSASFKECILLFVPLFGIWWLFNFRKYKLASNPFFCMLGFLPLFVLLCFRIFSLTGKFGIIATTGGATFYTGRTHVAMVEFRDAKRNSYFGYGSPVAAQKGYSGTERFNAGPYDSGFFFKEGLKEVRKDIPKAIAYSLENIYDLFYSTVIWPTSALEGIQPKVVKYFNIAFVVLVILPAIALLFFQFKRIVTSPQVLPYLALLVIIITAAVFIGDPRYRVPFDIFSIMLGGHFYSMVEFKRMKS